MTTELANPTIKGMFINSHFTALEKTHGEAAVQEIRRRTKVTEPFKPLADVPLTKEIEILAAIIDITHSDVLTPAEAHYQAGSLHFVNFQATPLGKLIFQALPVDFKTVFLKIDVLAQHIFSNMTVTTQEIEPTSFQIKVTNNAYPLEHWQGFFTAWLALYGKMAYVTGESISADTDIYTITWTQ